MTHQRTETAPLPAPDGSRLPDLFWSRVRAHPGRIAVRDGHRQLSYRELADRGSHLAALLRRTGVAPDDRVGVFVESSAELIVTVWGVLLAGGAYLPLSPEYPDERLRYLIEDSGARIIMAQPQTRARLSELAPPGVRIVIAGEAARSREPGPPPAADLRPDHLAYIIYTSGTTGRPKGVMIEHRSIVNQLRWLADAHRLGDQTVLQKTPMSFDAAQWEILAPACGSTVVAGGRDLYRDPVAMVATIREHGVTALQCVPTQLQAILDLDEAGRCHTLTRVFCGGEVLTRKLAQQCVGTLPWCRLVNLYGPTECTINTSAFVVEAATVAQGPDSIPIGVPVPDVRYRIVDDQGRPVAAGEFGELHIGGVQVARGYLDRPALTAERFLTDPIDGERWYRTGDLASWNDDGTVRFGGRTDNQVKVRGFRVELGEIESAIQSHEWVKNAAVVVAPHPRTRAQNLVAYVTLNPREAALMDQGRHGAHHRSKDSRLQVRVQLSNPGCREPGELAGRPVVDLPGGPATPDQRRRVFARKTYRFYEGGEVTRDDIIRLLAQRRDGAAADRSPDSLVLPELGEILRWFGQFISEQRLLPKYAYASPGALYAVQLHLELRGVAGLPAGHYYYHPVHHHLVRIAGLAATGPTRFRLHFVGKRRAIEPVYQTNLREVLEIEAGHMLGLFDEVLPDYGLSLGGYAYLPSVMRLLECAADDYCLGALEVVPATAARLAGPLEIYVQAHPARVPDLPAGQYRYHAGDLERISDELILRKHVVAINQRVYERASIGVTIMSMDTGSRQSYLDLGRKLQELQMNDLGLGFMSSGYSSRDGDHLPSARQITRILSAVGRTAGPSYFCVGGRVSPEQVRSEGMQEDAVHMDGPQELIKTDLARLLPDYMMPNRIVVLDDLPLTANGKVDRRILVDRAAAGVEPRDRPVVAARTRTERRLIEIWQTELSRDVVSVHDDFFESGGDSLLAVSMMNNINRRLGAALPVQAVFEYPTVELLARRVDAGTTRPASRMVPLSTTGRGRPIVCWPGLGGYPMSLRLLAGRLGLDRPCYGVQASGINHDEAPHTTIQDMAAEDVKLIQEQQPVGPYTLWGYSFGARVAFEAAYQIEQSGEAVDHLFLIAPGSPRVRGNQARNPGRVASFDDRHYLAILFSVFAGRVTGPLVDECLETVHDETSFCSFVTARFGNLDPDLVRRIVNVVNTTYEYEYTFRELRERRVEAPVTIFKARGDDYAFIAGSHGYSAQPPTVVELPADHYAIIRQPAVGDLVSAIRHRLGAAAREQPAAAPVATSIPDSGEEHVVPHVNIKHFPKPLSAPAERELVQALTVAVTRAFGCSEDVVSIALEPVDKDAWQERVYQPEIIDRKDLLRKSPSY